MPQQNQHSVVNGKHASKGQAYPHHVSDNFQNLKFLNISSQVLIYLLPKFH